MIKKIITISIVCIFLFGSCFSLQASNVNAGDELSNLQSSSSEKYLNNKYLRPNSPFSPEYKPGELIVKFLDKISFSISFEGFILTGIESVDKLNIEFGVSSVEKLIEYDSVSSLSKVYLLKLPINSDIISIAEKYKKDLNVEYAEPNYLYHLCATPMGTLQYVQEMSISPSSSFIPDDPLFDQQWFLDQANDCDIDAPEAWEIETGDPDMVIAVVDTGVDYNHVDLSDNIWTNPGEIPNNGKDDDNNGYIDDVRGWDFHNKDNSPMDSFGHGTHCSGIISSVTNNGIGIAGIACNCKIMPIRVGNLLVLLWNLLEGITYAADNSADIISMSFGAYIDSDTVKDALDYAYNQGIVLVAGVGNNGFGIEFYPAGYDNVIAVAATDQDDNRAYFSNHGLWIDVAAPGVDILSLRAKDTDMYEDGTHIVDEFYYIASGTSMSCPVVSGVVGLLLSNKPNLSQKEIKTIISNAVDEVDTTKYIGLGRINSYKALQKEPAIAVLDTIPKWNHGVEGILDINGTASGEGFQYYIVEYGRGETPVSWTELVNSTDTKEGNLASIDVSGLDDEIYSIQLRVICNSETYKDRIGILVNNKFNIVYVDDDNIDGPWNGSIEYPYFFIQDGIDNAGKNDEVFVCNGSYSGDVFLYKKIDLIGEDNDATVIDGNKTEKDGIVVLQSDIKITGFLLKNCHSGISLTFDIPSFGASNTRIFGNNIKNCIIGIEITLPCVNNVIYHNNFIDNTGNAMDGTYGLNKWYNPIKKEGNYWGNYAERYPFAKPCLFRPWIWNTAYRFIVGKDKYPLVEQFSGIVNIPGCQSIIDSQIQNTQHFTNPMLLRILERFPLLQKL
jgi:subtilisin family serine protease